MGLILLWPWGKKPGIKLSDSAEAEPETPRICAEILEEICFSSMERYNLEIKELQENCKEALMFKLLRAQSNRSLSA